MAEPVAVISPPRLAPDWELPGYAYVPGRAPHPVRDPAGHSYGATDEVFGDAPDAATYATHRAYRHVLDLFNRGFYWEAHEGLERWWRETPEYDLRRGVFQGLLRLCAAGVKVREGRSGGVEKHAQRAAELIGRAADAVSGEEPRLLGLDLGWVVAEARRISAAADEMIAGCRDLEGPLPALGMVLLPKPEVVPGQGLAGPSTAADKED